MRRWRHDLTLVAQAREDGDITVATADDVVVEQLLATAALGLRVLALPPDAPTSSEAQLAMLDSALAALASC